MRLAGATDPMTLPDILTEDGTEQNEGCGLEFAHLMLAESGHA